MEEAAGNKQVVGLFTLSGGVGDLSELPALFQEHCELLNALVLRQANTEQRGIPVKRKHLDGGPHTLYQTTPAQQTPCPLHTAFSSQHDGERGWAWAGLETRVRQLCGVSVGL